MSTLGSTLANVCRVSHRLLVKRLSRESDRSYQQLRALQSIAEEGIEMQAALAEHLFLDPPSVSRLVDRLEEEGLLKRCQGADRRCVRLAVTPAGRSAMAAMDRAMARHDETLRRCLTAAERRTLEQLLEKLESGLRVPHEPDGDV